MFRRSKTKSKRVVHECVPMVSRKGTTAAGIVLSKRRAQTLDGPGLGPQVAAALPPHGRCPYIGADDGILRPSNQQQPCRCRHAVVGASFPAGRKLR